MLSTFIRYVTTLFIYMQVKFAVCCSEGGNSQEAGHFGIEEKQNAERPEEGENEAR